MAEIVVAMQQTTNGTKKKKMRGQRQKESRQHAFHASTITTPPIRELTR
jgi:hypothetical protein